MAVLSASLLGSAFGARAAVGATLVAGGDVATQTWNAAGSPYVVTGDLHVPAGATLTIDAGTVVAFAKSDALHAGADGQHIELTVDGALAVTGSAGSPVVFRSQSGSNSDTWYGVVIGSGASGASVTGAIFRDAQFGIHSSASGLAVKDVTIRDCPNTGVWVYAGSATIDGVTVIGDSNNGIAIGSGVTATPVSATITNAVITKATAAVSLIGNGPVMVKLSSTTLDGNHLGVQFVSGGPGSSLDVTDTIVSNDSTYGLLQNQADAQVSVTHSDFYKNAMGDIMGASLGSGSISANPEFVSSSDWHLQASSPAVGAGAGGGPATDRDGTPRSGNDMGACEPGGSGEGCTADAGQTQSTEAIAMPDSSAPMITGQAGASGGGGSGSSASAGRTGGAGGSASASSTGSTGCAITAPTPSLFAALSVLAALGVVMFRARRRRSL